MTITGLNIEHAVVEVRKADYEAQFVRIEEMHFAFQDIEQVFDCIAHDDLPDHRVAPIARMMALAARSYAEGAAKEAVEFMYDAVRQHKELRAWQIQNALRRAQEEDAA